LKLIDIIKKRHVAHKYKEDKVAKDKLDKIIDAARFAPSSHNSQDWKFIIIKNKKMISDLFDLCIYGEFYSVSPVAIVVVAEPLYVNDKKKGLLKLENKLSSHKYMNIGFAASNIVLEAESLGLNTSILSLDVKKANKLLGVPDESEALLMIAIGHEEKVKYDSSKKKKKRSEVVMHERYR
jgi:nitroreductase